MDEKRQAALDRLQDVSPLEAASVLEELELYDSVSSIQIIDEVTEQFKSGEHLEDEVLKPVFMSVIDGLLEATSMGRAARKKGLTASRVVQECEQFSYDTAQDENGNAHNENMAGKEFEGKNSNMSQEYDRKKHGDQGAIDKYKDDGYKEKHGYSNNREKNLEDEYTGKSNLYRYQDNPNKNYKNDAGGKLAETDHIMPLKKVHEKFSNNYVLDDSDIKCIGNIEDNFAVTSKKINRGKLDKTNAEYIKMMEDKGTPVDEKTKQIMRDKQASAERAVDWAANKTVINNLMGKGQVNEATLKKAREDYIRKYGRKPDENELKEKLLAQKTKEIRDITKKNAQSQAEDYTKDYAKNYAVGNLILFIVKPLYYEIKDIFKNGLKNGVGVSSSIEAFSIRFGRLKKYVLTNAAGFLGNNVWELVKGIVSSLVEGIISLFVGIFKQVLKLLKEGIKIFVQAAKVLWGKNSKEMSSAEKGDAIIKLIGGSVIAIAGIGIEFLLNKIGIGEPWSVVLSTMLSGIASALFMYLLDKADLFSVKSEKRRNRILEIFNERINDIHKARDTWNITVLDALKRQRENFDEISNEIDYGLQINNIDVVNNGLFKMADFMKVDLEYSDLDEFCNYMSSNKVVKL